MSIRNYFIVCFLLNFILINNLYSSNNSQKSFSHILSRDCEGLSQDECSENPECDWSIVTTPNGVFEMCVDADNWGGDGGWDFGCEELTEDECVSVPWCSWSEEDGCYRPDNWNDDGGWQNECEGLGYEDCEYLDFCEWVSDSDNPNSMGFCVEAALDDGGWNDDGGWQSECEGLSYEDCEYLDFCEWISDSDNPNSMGFCIDAGGPSPCSAFNEEDCEWYDECIWTDQGCQDYDWNNDCNPDMICGQALTCVDELLYPTTCGPENCDEPIGVCDDNDDDGPPECILDCPGIEDINPSENPYDACDWVISTFGNDPGFASCINDCDEETMMEVYEIVEACFDCLSDTTLDCSDVFNDDNCSDLSMDECADAEGCQPNYDAAGQFEGCEENNNQEDGCFEDGEWFCYGCEYFINECEYFECTENGWNGPFVLDECGEGDGGGCDDGGDLLAYLELEDTVGMPGNEVIVPMYLTSPVPVGGVQFKLFENYDGIIPAGITSMDDCFTANYNNLDEAFIGIIFSLEGCSYPANETVHIANLVFEISHFVPIGIETTLEFDYTIVADFEGNEVSSCGIGASILLGMQGDVNGDGEINVIDIVLAVSFAILTDYPSDSEFWASDVNNDGIINVLDIVQLVNMVLNG